ncbi:MAG: hypothetical protein KatS3mg060_2042 [Dehalococcoidia bacterium]|nr:MAG: hypothetical protein KatS3mg060_2042 [Dehalococcoidia bacterium]
MNETSAPSLSRVGDQLRMLASIAEQVDRLEAENRALSEERERLRGSLAEAQTRLGQVREERDRLHHALENARRELAQAAEREAARRGEAVRIAEALREIAERDAARLRELADQLTAPPEASTKRAAEEPSPPPASVQPPTVSEPPAGEPPASEPVAVEEPASVPAAEAVAEVSAPAEVAAPTEPAPAAVPEPPAEAAPEPPAEAAPEPPAEAAPPPPMTETYELAASPFSSFSTLIAFQKAVASLPGVEDVRTKSFLNGALVLSLRYSGRDPLTASLSRLAGFRAERVSAVGNRIEFVVAPESGPRSA